MSTFRCPRTGGYVQPQPQVNHHRHNPCHGGGGGVTQYHAVHKETFGEVVDGRHHNQIRGGGGRHHGEKGGVMYNGRHHGGGVQNYRYEEYEEEVEEEEHVSRYEAYGYGKACGQEGGYSTTSSHRYKVYEEEEEEEEAVVAVAGSGFGGCYAPCKRF